ncbi:MAG: SBBP repeat-containing protein [Pyrinomonadaceae bacterium]
MLIGSKISNPKFYGALVILAGVCLSLVMVSHTKARAAGGNADTDARPERPNNSPLKQTDSFGQMPFIFERNQGQADKTVKFLGRGPGYTLLLTDQGATFKLRQNGQPASTVKMELVGANAGVKITGSDQLAAKTNYYTGGDPRGWHTGVSNFARVQYHNVYAGIDAVYYAANNDLEYDLIVAPNTDPSVIKLKFTGAEKLSLDQNGNLQIMVNGQVLEQRAPVSYQENNGKREPIESRFALTEGNQVSFVIGAYDHSRPLFVDPAMRYLTYIGGNNGDDSLASVAVDAQQNTYLTGSVDSTDFTTDNAPLDPDNEGGAFVAKLNPNGTQLLYLTIFDGNDVDSAADVAVDNFGNAYITGQTRSDDFPVHNAYQDSSPRCLRVNNCYWRETDTFVAKVNGVGLVVNSTYLAGRDSELAAGIAVRGNGDLVYVTGYTYSADFPDINGYQSGGAFGNGGDAFLTVMPMNGGAPIYSTHFGGNHGESAEDVAIDAAGNAYITGDTDSDDLPIRSAFQTNNLGGSDSFIAKFNPFASGDASLVYSTYLGGAGGDYARGIAVTPQGKAYVTGVTGSFNFPMLNAIDTTNQVNEAFVTAFNTNGSLFASTFLGGNGQDFGNAITLDVGEVVYLTGSTTSADFPRSFPFQNSRAGAQDAFVSKLRLGPATSALISSTYLGGTGSEDGKGIAVLGNKHIYVVGSTTSNDLPTSGGAVKHDVVLGSSNSQGFAAHLLDTQRDTVGVYEPAATNFLLRNTISPTGNASIISVDFGTAGDVPVTADWNGDGIDTTGTFNAGVWRYRNLNVFSGYLTPPFTFNFGQIGDIPVAGDWNGNGIETPGVYRPSTQEFLLSDSLTNPQANHVVKFGVASDLPVVGDWNGDGIDTPGTYRPSDGRFRLTNAITGIPAAPDNTFQLGANQDLPIAGDWNADGFDDVGLWKPSTFTFSFDTNKADGTDLPSLVFGSAGNLPLAGEWEGRP